MLPDLFFHVFSIFFRMFPVSLGFVVFSFYIRPFSLDVTMFSVLVAHCNDEPSLVASFGCMQSSTRML